MSTPYTTHGAIIIKCLALSSIKLRDVVQIFIPVSFQAVWLVFVLIL